MAATTQYSSAAPFFGKASDNVVSEADKQRLQAYAFYEDAYHNRPETFRVSMRGDDDTQVPIYLPACKKIVEATNRFLAVDFDFVVDPNSGTPEEQATVARMMRNLFKREKMYTKHATQRRYGLIRGDAVWHITADDTKTPGSRLSIHELHPSNYFPIEDPANPDRIMGCHIVDTTQDPRSPNDRTKIVARRQTYRRTMDANGNPTGEITSELTTWEIGKWDDRNLEAKDLKPVSVIKAQYALPSGITTLPVYHFRNNRIPEEQFGLSEVAGIETIFAAMNQSVTDEDMTLVMQGLGMYWSNAAPPLNADGTDGDWEIGPGSVIEVGDGQQFGRVTGVSSVAPFIEHMKFIDEYGQQALGVPDIAVGKVDQAIAESGISLRLQMGPILAKNGEKEQEILGIYDQMFFDIAYQWFPAYEQVTFTDIEVASVVGDPLPTNRDARIQEVLLLFTSGLITIAMAQSELSKYGYNFAADSVQQALADTRALALAQNPDPFDNRFQEETALQQKAANPQGFTTAPTNPVGPPPVGPGPGSAPVLPVKVGP